MQSGLQGSGKARGRWVLLSTTQLPGSRDRGTQVRDAVPDNSRPRSPPGLGCGCAVTRERGVREARLHTGLGLPPAQGQLLIQIQTLAEVLPLGIEGVQLGSTGPVLLPLVAPVTVS